ncbi:MAG: HAD-IIB family hydrolase [Chloroflexi bacterium]|nr:HAD-IIB family hydrolase [Chloroflexota bacterium]
MAPSLRGQTRMRYVALASDYDGTLAVDGLVTAETLQALERLRGSGRKAILVTGRELPDLLHVFPEIELFDHVVAENGAVLYCPATKAERLLAEAPPPEFALKLAEKGVTPLGIGRVIVATREPYEQVMLEVIRELGLELHVIFNKGAVMALPANINKTTGLTEALAELKLSPQNMVAVGDAENDHIFLSACECGVAVANALPSLKERADWVTEGARGEGVTELIDRLVADDLAFLQPRLRRHRIPIGLAGGEELCLEPYGRNVLLAGPTGSGKSTMVTAILQKLGERGYQYVLTDPDGTCKPADGSVILGERQQAPEESAVLQLLEQPNQNVVLNLSALAGDARSGFLLGLLPKLEKLRAKTGRPHWLVLDGADQLLPPDTPGAEARRVPRLSSTLLITSEPEQVHPLALGAADTVIAMAQHGRDTLAAVSRALHEPLPLVPKDPGDSTALWWDRRARSSPQWLRVETPQKAQTPPATG